MKLAGVSVKWKGHDCFKFEKDGLVLYIDPFNIVGSPRDAKIVLITHEHYDHCSPKDLQKVISENTIIVCPPSCQSTIARLGCKEMHVVTPGKKYTIAGIPLETVPAYNINKFRTPGHAFHPKDNERVGYVITIDNKRFFHAGDTDNIPEIRLLEDIDVAFVPVSGTYVMTPEEAASCVNTFKPKLAVPMHIGSIVGSKTEANKFRELAQVPVKILIKE